MTKKIIMSGNYTSAVHTTRCIRCNCVFEYNENDVYEKMEVPPPGAHSNPYGYVRFVVDCPECGWQVPGIKMVD